MKLLRQLAVGVDENDVGENLFCFKGNRYKKILPFNIEILLADIRINKDFRIITTTEDDRKYLWIAYYTTSGWNKDRKSRARLLSLVFNNFEEALPTQHNNIEKEIEVELPNRLYITSKLFEKLRKAHENDQLVPQVPHNVQHELLRVKLRPYQCRTVRWLLHRELSADPYPEVYKVLRSSDAKDENFFLNIWDLSLCTSVSKTPNLPTGGILADEMGLGKTVEMLTLMLLNPRELLPSREDETLHPIKKIKLESKFYCICSKPRNKLLKVVKCRLCGAEQHEKCVRNFCVNMERDHVCPNCWEGNILVETGATIIVSPEAIKNQWYSEIKKHIDSSIKVLIYNGISNMRWISPQELSEYDIVLTDYNVLRKEIYYSSSNMSKCNLRRPKSYMRVSSPLVMVQWWRVCLDEAQMVESTKTFASLMVKRLPAIHRWAVTGTPIQKSMDDLRGLLQFLDIVPFNDVHTFCRLITLFQKDDTEPLISLLKKIMWRTCKSSVQAELQIPPRTEIVHYVSLSDLEKLFYKNYHSDCAAAFNDKVSKLGVGSKILSNIDPKTLNLLLDPLKLLRQSCTVPIMLVQKSEQSYKSYKKVLEPKELLEHLKAKNELECKSHLRTIASCYNGMAAIHIIRREFAQAIKSYEAVMRRAEDYKGPISVDSLLQIHALHNLIYTYENFIEEKDDNKIEMFKEQCNKLEWKYIEGYYSNLKKVELIHDSLNKDIATSVLLNKKEQCWWRNILNECDIKNCADGLISRINDERYVNYRHTELASDNLRNIHGINYLLTVWFEKIMDMRKKVLGKFDKLKAFTKLIKPTSELLANEQRLLNDFVKNTFNCHLNILTSRKKSKKTCPLCTLKETLDIYECYIFNKKFDENRKQAEGSRNPTFHETIMRTILSFAKVKNFAETDIKEGEDCLHLLENMKKEYDELWKVWIETEYTVKAYDELDMCKWRLQVFNPESADKPKDKASSFYILPEEVEINFLQLTTQLSNAENIFVRKLARWKYINYLESNTDPGICPICNSKPESKYIVLECGHHLCVECFNTLKKYQRSALTCSICRNSQKYENIYFVTCKPSCPKPNEIVAKGDYSSKIEAVVTAVLKLKEENKEVKILIFSQWNSVLSVLSNALKENDITYKMRKSKNFIDDFKDLELGITCILLLLSQGAKGLNLVEATHVFLVEPILNPGEELQAIDRIHRIGQTRPTFVHRFISKNTIEEQIFNTISKDCAQKWELNDVTIENIQNLFAQHSKE